MPTNSWETAKIQYDNLVKRFDQTRNSNDLYDALSYVTNYLMSDRSCLPAAYAVAQCHYMGMVCNVKFADPAYAINLLQQIYELGYIEAAFLLSNIYHNLSYDKECFRWTKIYIEHEPDALNSRRRLANYYSEGRGTLQNFNIADRIYDDLMNKCKDDYDFEYDYAKHLLRKRSIESFYWAKRAVENAPDQFELGGCFGLIVEIALAFDDIFTAYSYKKKKKKLSQSVNDEETRKFLIESYANSENTITLYKMEKKQKVM